MDYPPEIRLAPAAKFTVIIALAKIYADRGSCKDGFSVILHEVKDLKLLEIRDSLRSE
jgi:hypothetical protein